MKIEKVHIAAKILYNSRIKRSKIIKLPNDCTPKNKNEAYKIQEKLRLFYQKKNNKVIGKKIGCTNKQAQKQINVKEPFYGNIYSKYSDKNNAILKRKNFIKPFCEPEFSFKLKNIVNLGKGPYTKKHILKYIDQIIPSIEIVDSRFVDWTKIGINNIIADNAVNSFWIKGKEKKFENMNLSNHKVKIYRNNKLIKIGNSNNVLKNPINSIIWLLNTLHKQNKHIPKNFYVSTGTCTPAIPLEKKDKIKADFGSLGKVEFKLI